MKVLICGTLQVVPDNTNLSNKPWVELTEEPRMISQGDRIWINKNEYIVTLIPKNPCNLYGDWTAFAISLHYGSRYDEGQFVNQENWTSFPLPSSWK